MSVFAFLPVVFWKSAFIFLNYIFLKSVFVVFYEIVFKHKYDKIQANTLILARKSQITTLLSVI